MIVLDTNVVSEAIKARTNPQVGSWIDRQQNGSLYLTATSLAELLFGMESMPDGRRKGQLAAALNELLTRLFGSRILAFDQKAAIVYGSVLGRARSSGRAISVPDGQIAAIALAHGFSVATRDVRPFVAAGVEVINPWEYTPTTDD